VLGAAHLRRTLGKYAAYYNESRIHRSLNKDAPLHGRSSASAPSHHNLSLADFITHIAESDFPYTHRCNFQKGQATQSKRKQFYQRRSAPTIRAARPAHSNVTSVFADGPVGGEPGHVGDVEDSYAPRWMPIATPGRSGAAPIIGVEIRGDHVIVVVVARHSREE